MRLDARLLQDPVGGEQEEENVGNVDGALDKAAPAAASGSGSGVRGSARDAGRVGRGEGGGRGGGGLHYPYNINFLCLRSCYLTVQVVAFRFRYM